MKHKLISVVIPVHNEEANVPLVYASLVKARVALGTYDYEYIFVDDGSTDGSVHAIQKLIQNDPRVHCIEFSRNFGKEMATTAGIEAAKGDAVIMIDADLQHPPELIPQFVEKWEAGAEVVVGMRTTNASDRFATRVGSSIFHSISRLISDTDIYKGETDFRLIDRVVVDAFTQLPEHERMTRSLINWLGFRRVNLAFAAPARINGTAQYSTAKLIHLALFAFISNSLLPLRLAGYLGVLIASSSFLLGTIIFIERYVFNDALGWSVSGSAQLAIINGFLIGVVLMCLGVIALYIGKIHVEVAKRPLYVVRRRTNI